ncbi:hypothetical protein PICSAR145_04448 [Mycobacterium avium subsp. paratuberculosis]|nr:hypothetical protein PICSAR145_04448 [Mycobacterium avium subsp. paratuberculosis]
MPAGAGAGDKVAAEAPGPGASTAAAPPPEGAAATPGRTGAGAPPANPASPASPATPGAPAAGMKGAIRPNESWVNCGTCGVKYSSDSPAQCGTSVASSGSLIRSDNVADGFDGDWLRSPLMALATSCTRVTHQLSWVGPPPASWLATPVFWICGGGAVGGFHVIAVSDTAS